ncbi:MAG: efflux RND transporter periplasmic adaptor subunit, partial [Flavobacteriales bacterium]|nr:efflux RND transporter periplasmic adaptor subunit [Flavobacteriales bacterium]
MKINIKVYAAVIATLFLISSCGHTEHGSEDGHDHGTADEGHEEHEEGAEEVHFSEQQFKSLGMQVGGLSTRNIGAYVEANGQLEVPPQNEASVSTYIGANVVSIEVIEGDKVSKGKVLAYLSHPNLIQLQTDYLAAYNSLSYLEKDYLRQKGLYEEKVGSGKDLQRLEAEFLSAKGKSKGYEAQLRLLGLDVKKIQQAEIAERIPVISPIAGHVRTVEVKTGQYVEPQAEMFELVNVDHIHADLMVFEKDVHKVKEGQKVKFSVESHNQYDLEATIYSVGKAFENEPKAVHLHAEIENKKGLLLPGMYVRGRILAEETSAQALPTEAIVKEGERYYVFTAGKESEGEKV